MLFTRRNLLLTGAAGATMASTPAFAESGRLAFDINRNGERVGSHDVRLRRSGDQIEVDIDIDIKVGLGFVTLYRYTHTNREIYEGTQLVAMSSRTNDNGTPHRVDVRRRGDELVIDGDDGTIRAPGNLFPTTYWQPRSVSTSRWIDSQSGRVVESSVQRVGTEIIRYEGRDVACDRYALRGEVDLDLWYGPHGWSKLAFNYGGSNIDYVRRPESDVASLSQAVAS